MSIVNLIPNSIGKFTNNVMIINVQPENENYNKNGKFIASASSNPNAASNAFDNDYSTAWQCSSKPVTSIEKPAITLVKELNNNDTITNAINDAIKSFKIQKSLSNIKTVDPPIVYKQNPYKKSSNGPSTYQGGGDIHSITYYKTHINKLNKYIPGEWLQIKIPMATYLNSYTIATPQTMFPQCFYIVGSNDGIKWYFLDTHTIKNNKNLEEATFNLNSIEKYTYFRLIINSLFENNDIVTIIKWQISGVIEDSPINNINYSKNINIENGESFSNISANSFTPINNYTPTYTYYNNSSVLVLSEFEIKKDINTKYLQLNNDLPSAFNSLLVKENKLDVINKNNNKYNYIILPVLVTSSLLISLLYNQKYK